MLLVHHRIKLISVLVDGQLYIVPEQRYHARTSFRFVASSVKTAKRIMSLMDRLIYFSFFFRERKREGGKLAHVLGHIRMFQSLNSGQSVIGIEYYKIADEAQRFLRHLW